MTYRHTPHFILTCTGIIILAILSAAPVAAQPGPGVPTISSISPDTVEDYGPAFTLTVNGTGFTSGAIVRWNGSPLVTTFVNASRITAAVDANLIALFGQAMVTVETPGGTSNPALLTIRLARPTITSFVPDSAAFGSGSFTLTINGSDFVPGTSVDFPGQPLTATFVNSSQISVVLQSNLYPSPDLVPFSVFVGVHPSNTAVFRITPGPTISTLAPSSATAGSGGFTLKVNGSNFVQGQAVQWNGSALATTFVSATQLSASVPANLIAQAGTANIRVAFGEGLSFFSNTVPFTINLGPSITGIDPTSVTAGGAAFTLKVNGSNFVQGHVIQWNGSSLSTTFGTPTQLSAAVPANLIAVAGPANIRVAFGEGLSFFSNTVPFTINLGPSITGIDPIAATAGGAAFTLKVNGSNFIQGQAIQWNGASLPTNVVSAAQLSASVPANLIAQAGTANIRVAFGEGLSSFSNTVPFPINLPPMITTTDPTAVTVGFGPFTLKVNGSNFVAGVEVRWNGSALPTVVTNATQLSASVPAALIAQAGTASIGVASGTVLSNILQFTINPGPTVTSTFPSTMTAGGSAFTLTVNGTGFVPGVAVQWNGSRLETSFVSTVQLTAAVPASLIAAAGTANIGVLSGAVGSNTVPLTITPPLTLTVNPSSLSFSYQQGGAPPAPKPISVTSSGVGALNYTASVSGGSWLTVSPLSGATPNTLLVSVNPGSLTPDTYSGTITITNGTTASDVKTVQVSLVVSPRPVFTVAPSTISFAYQQGGSAPLPKTLSVSAGGTAAANFTAAVSSNSNWLTVNPLTGTTPASVTVSADGSNLAQGAYVGSITLTPAAGAGVPQVVAVSLVVSGTATLTVSPGALTYQYRTEDGIAPPAQSLSVFLTAGSGNYSATASTTSGGNWLTLGNASGAVPGSISASVNAAGLIAGTYVGQIQVSSESANPKSVMIPVTLTVVGPKPVQLTVTPLVINASAVQGGGPVFRQVQISNQGGGQGSFTVQSTGGSWLSVTPVSGSATGQAPVTLSVTMSPVGLAAGTNSGQLSIVGADGKVVQNIAVTLAVSGRPQSMLLTQSGMEFVAFTGGAAPPPQVVGVLNVGSGAMAWTVETTTLTGGSAWLTATTATPGAPNAGTSTGNSGIVPLINVGTDPKGLAVGQYYGTVRVTAPGTAAPLQVVSVLLKVFEKGKADGTLAVPSGVIVGTDNPSSEVFLYSLGGGLSFNATQSTEDGGNWISVTPASGIVSGDKSLKVVVQSQLSGLQAGIRKGTVRVAFGDGSVRTITVVSVVTGTASTAIGSLKSTEERAAEKAAACVSSELVPVFQKPEQGFNVTGGEPVSVKVLLKDNCENLIANGQSVDLVATSGTSNYGTITAKPAPEGKGIYGATWVPGRDGAPRVRLAVTTVAQQVGGTGYISNKKLVEINGSVTVPGAGAGATPKAVVNSASYTGEGRVAPGSSVSVFGDGLADGLLSVDKQPYPGSLIGTQIELGGQVLRLRYVSDKQVNAIIPQGLDVNAEQPLLVFRNGTQSSTIPLTVSDVQPAIYSTDQSGSGQGSVLLAGQGVLAAAPGAFPGSKPVKRGDFIEIYCTGLGAVKDAPPDGVAATDSPLSRVVATTTVFIGEVSAQVSDAVLAPGAVGLYQVNVRVPDNAPTGAAVPIYINMGQSKSNVVTIAVE